MLDWIRCSVLLCIGTFLISLGLFSCEVSYGKWYFSFSWGLQHFLSKYNFNMYQYLKEFGVILAMILLAVSVIVIFLYLTNQLWKLL